MYSFGSSRWQEQADVKLQNLEQRLAMPFSFSVLRGLYVIARTAVKYAERYDVVLADAVSGITPAEVTKGVIDLARAGLGLDPAEMRAVGGRCRKPFPVGLLPEPADKDATLLIVTDSVYNGGSVNNLAERAAKQRSNGLIHAATVGASLSRGVRPARLRRGALYIVGGPAENTDPYLHPDYIWVSPSRPDHPPWSRWTKRDREDQFAIEKRSEQMDVAAVARHDRDVQEVISTFAGMLGIEGAQASRTED